MYRPHIRTAYASSGVQSYGAHFCESGLCSCRCLVTLGSKGICGDPELHPHCIPLTKLIFSPCLFLISSNPAHANENCCISNGYWKDKEGHVPTPMASLNSGSVSPASRAAFSSRLDSFNFATSLINTLIAACTAFIVVEAVGWEVSILMLGILKHQWRDANGIILGKKLNKCLQSTVTCYNFQSQLRQLAKFGCRNSLAAWCPHRR